LLALLVLLFVVMLVSCPLAGTDPGDENPPGEKSPPGGEEPPEELDPTVDHD
jgi:hypothetical protein